MRTYRLTALATLVLAALLTITGLASAQPGYGEGGPTVGLSASASGDSITAVGSGFVPGEPVTGTVFSDPMGLGTKDANAAGTVSFTFSVRSLAPGEHRVVLSAPSGSASATFTVTGAYRSDTVAKVADTRSSYKGPSGTSAGGTSAGDNSSYSGNSYSGNSASGNSAGGSGGELAYTGSDLIVPMAVGGLLLLVGGGAAVAVSRRRRSETTNRS